MNFLLYSHFTYISSYPRTSLSHFFHRLCHDSLGSHFFFVSLRRRGLLRFNSFGAFARQITVVCYVYILTRGAY
jgi:hypothetical protein